MGTSLYWEQDRGSKKCWNGASVLVRLLRCCWGKVRASNSFQFWPLMCRSPRWWVSILGLGSGKGAGEHEVVEQMQSPFSLCLLPMIKKGFSCSASKTQKDFLCADLLWHRKAFPLLPWYITGILILCYLSKRQKGFPWESYTPWNCLQYVQNSSHNFFGAVWVCYLQNSTLSRGVKKILDQLASHRIYQAWTCSQNTQSSSSSYSSFKRNSIPQFPLF